MKRPLRILWIFAFLLGGCVLAAALWLPGEYVVPIIMYHHVREAPVFRTDTVSPQKFAEHMAFLKGRGYNVIGLDELVEGIRKGRRFPHNTVVLTFDDGYEDNFTKAFPVLARNGFPATFFIRTAKVGSRDKEAYLDWSQIKQMHEGGMSFGSHTVHHAYLPDVPEDEQVFEITRSKSVLEEELGGPVDYLAYPMGGFDEAVKDLTRKAGYWGAVTTNRGRDRFNKDVYEINRIRFSDHDDSNFILMVKLSGYYNFFRKLKDPY